MGGNGKRDREQPESKVPVGSWEDKITFPVKSDITEGTISYEADMARPFALSHRTRAEAKIVIDPFLFDNPSRNDRRCGFLTDKSSTQGSDR